MTFVGEDGLAAPQLNELEEADFQKIARSTLMIVRRLVIDAKMVHGDLSAYNILVWRDEPFLIDLSQAVLVGHPDAPRLLRRDMENLADFFAKRGVGVKPFHDMLADLQEHLTHCRPHHQE